MSNFYLWMNIFALSDNSNYMQHWERIDVNHSSKFIRYDNEHNLIIFNKLKSLIKQLLIDIFWYISLSS